MDEKVNQGYLPSVGEDLQGYVERLRHILAEQSGYLQKHTGWYVHRGTGECPICNLENIGTYICDMLLDVSISLKKSKKIFKCEQNKTSSDPLTFVFLPHPQG